MNLKLEDVDIRFAIMINFSLHQVLKSAKFSELAYKEFKEGFKILNKYLILSHIYNEETDTTVYIIYEKAKNIIYISWRGTESFKDWITDSEINKVSAFNVNKMKVHSGFYNCYMSVRVRVLSALVRHYNTYNKPEIVVTGHSLGGALATLNIYDIIKSSHVSNVSVYTFGSPRVGNSVFRDEYNKTVSTTYRFVHDMDIVPRVPKVGFNHVSGMGIYVNSDGKIFKWYERLLSRIFWYPKVLYSDIIGESIKDHMMSNYIKSLNKIKE